MPPINIMTNVPAPTFSSPPSGMSEALGSGGTLPTYTFGAGGPAGVNNFNPGAGNVNYNSQPYYSAVPIVAPQTNVQPQTGAQSQSGASPTGSAAMAPDQADNWRMVLYGNRWWYWTPAHRWMYFDNGNWQVFHGRYTTGPAPTPYTASAPAPSR